MKLMLTDNRLLKESVNVISDLVNEVNLGIDKNKIEIKALDPANIAMVDFKLLSTAFAEYEVEEPMVLAIRLDDLKAVLKRAKPIDTIILTHDPDKNRLIVNIIGDNKRTFSIALLDTDDNEQRLPQNLAFSSRILLPTQKFDEAIEDADIVSDNVALIAESEQFVVKASGNIHEANISIPQSSETEINMAEGVDSVKAKYSIDYLKKMIKGSKLSDSVSIEFSDDYPLKLEYVLVDRLKLSFILAPRVED